MRHVSILPLVFREKVRANSYARKTMGFPFFTSSNRIRASTTVNLGSNTVTVLGKSQQQFFGTVYTTFSLILHFGSA